MIFGIGSPKFKGTGTPDSNVVTLSNSVINPTWDIPRVLEHQSVISGKKNYITLGDYASFVVTMNLFKYGTPTTTFNTIMSYFHQLVTFFPHVDGVTSGDGLGKPLSNLTSTITGATKANPCSITSTAHGLTTGDRVFIFGVSGMTQLNQNIYVITVVDANTFTLGVDSTTYGTYTSGGSAIRTVNYFISEIKPYYLNNADAKQDLLDITFVGSNYVNIQKTTQ